MPIRTTLSRLVTFVALVAALALAGAVPARAGSYDVRSCTVDPTATPPRAVTGADDAWQFETDDSAHLESVRQCPPDADSGVDGLIARDKLNTAGVALGRFAHWRFDAPPGTTLTRLRLWRYAGKQANTWRLYTRTAEGTDLAGSDCTQGPSDFFCVVGGFGAQALSDWSVNTSSLRVGFVCDEVGQCATGHTLHETWTGIYSAVVTVNDPTAPTASGGTGSLFAGGYVHGTVSAGVSSASDATGIRAFEVRANGDVAAASADRSSCDFSRRAPCPNIATPESFSFDSRSIADGTHTVQVGVLDAGQNFAAARTEQVTVDNTAPVAPTPTSPTSVSTDATATAISWAEPGGQIAPIATAHVTVCGPSGCQVRTQAAGGGAGSATIGLPAYGTYTVAVALEDAAGNVNRGQAAGWTITRPAPAATPAPTTPVPPAPIPTAAPSAAKASPRLLVGRPTVARDRRTITVRGTVAFGVSGNVTVNASARIQGRTRTVTRKVTIRRRRYSVRLRLPSSAWKTAKVTVRYPGSATRRAATATRTVRRAR